MAEHLAPIRSSEGHDYCIIKKWYGIGFYFVMVFTWQIIGNNSSSHPDSYSWSAHPSSGFYTKEDRCIFFFLFIFISQICFGTFRGEKRKAINKGYS